MVKRVEVRAYVSNEVLLRFVLIDNSVCISWTNSFSWMLYLYISTMHADCYQWCHRIRVIPRPRLPDYQKLLASPCILWRDLVVRGRIESRFTRIASRPGETGSPHFVRRAESWKTCAELLVSKLQSPLMFAKRSCS